MMKALHSCPAPKHGLWLDFEGSTVRWGLQEVVTPPFHLSEDAAVEVWREVSQHFDGFDVDVSTEEPLDYIGPFLRVCIGGRGEWTGIEQGGVAIPGGYVYGTPGGDICFVFSQRMSQPHYIARACSHEAGHAYGLLHQMKFPATGNPTLNSGNQFRAPIMGHSTGARRALWWRGPNEKKEMQDDRAVLESVLGKRPVF